MKETVTTLVSGHTDLDEFVAAIEGETILAFDAEGVNLSRTGRATLCMVGINGDDSVHVFLFDVSDDAVEYQRRQISTLKSFLEDPTVTKIIHDCRQDSDSLNEFFHIRIVKVFETSVYNLQIKDTTKRDNLNHTLAEYGCPINAERHPNDFYDSHPNYWLERPLTEMQITSAAQDVSFLFLLKDSITERMADVSERKKYQIQDASEGAISEFREKRFTVLVEVPTSKFGLVIGRGGSTISMIERVSGALVGCSNTKGFFVLAASQANLDSAKKMILDKIKERRGSSYSRDY
jgi:ribonuclease D